MTTADVLREWVAAIVTHHLAQFDDAITDPTEPLMVQHPPEDHDAR